MDVRRLILALAASMAVFVLYQMLISRFYRPAAPATAPTAIPGYESAAPQPGAPAPAPPTSAAAISAVPPADYSFSSGHLTDLLSIGGGPTDALELVLSPRGAAVAKLRLTERTARTGRFVHRAGPRGNEPYEVLAPIEADGEIHQSFETHRLWFYDGSNRSWLLGELVWEVVERTPLKATFATSLRERGDGQAEVLRLTKRYEIPDPAKPLVSFSLELQNQSGNPLTVVIEQDTALGIHELAVQRDVRRVLAATASADGLEVLSKQRAQLTDKPDGVSLVGPQAGRLVWAALANKYFTVVTRPLDPAGGPGFIRTVLALAAAPRVALNPGDLEARLVSTPLNLPPRQPLSLNFEVYAGPKDPEVLKRVNPAFAQRSELGYNLIQAADLTCVCTFQPLPELMAGLLEMIHFVVRNYGLAIIGLVIIVRGALHPLAVFQQKAMYRMAEATARLHPKMEALKERYANDKVRLNQEMMKLWAEENVNPAASLLAMVPLFIQMPILVALWVALSSDINLRNAPFDGWWIKDLSQPDAFVTFTPPGLTIPVLAWFPLIGQLFTNIPYVNILPIVMGVSMWLQQKYMPKPSSHARQELAKNAPPPAPRKSGSGLTPEEQMRQQTMIGYMMAVLFPLMFYNMPSGLNLYWLSTNVFGICESLLIRRQIAREKERREKLGIAPPPRKGAGLMSRVFKHLADQAEQLQKKADQLSERK